MKNNSIKNGRDEEIVLLPQTIGDDGGIEHIKRDMKERSK